MSGDWTQWIEQTPKGTRATAFRHFVQWLPRRAPQAVQPIQKAVCGLEVGISPAAGHAPNCPECFAAWYAAQAQEVERRQTLAAAALGEKTNEFARWIKGKRGQWGMDQLKGNPNPDSERIAEALLATMESLPKIVAASVDGLRMQTQADLHRLQMAVLDVSGCPITEKEARERRR